MLTDNDKGRVFGKLTVLGVATKQRDELLAAAQLCIKENVFAPLMKAIASVKEKA